MDRIIKSRIFAFILGAIIFSGITVVAAYNYAASQISYSPKDTTSKVNNVQDAIDELYKKADGTICKKLSGNANTVGSKYACDPGDGEYRIFYILEVRNNDVDLIMDRNITQGKSKKIYKYSEATSYFTSGEGKNIIANWKNVKSVSLPGAEAIAHAANYSNWTLQNDNGWFYFESHNTTSKNTSGTYSWLYSYLSDCYSSKCEVSLDSNEASGYWTKDLRYSDNSVAKAVYKTGSLTQDGVNDTERHGVRPVITVLKSQLN